MSNTGAQGSAGIPSMNAPSAQKECIRSIMTEAIKIATENIIITDEVANALVQEPPQDPEKCGVSDPHTVLDMAYTLRGLIIAQNSKIARIKNEI